MDGPIQKSTEYVGNKSVDGPFYLTLQQLADRTSLSVSTLRRLLKNGRLRGFQPGGPGTRIVFRPDAIEILNSPTSLATETDITDKTDTLPCRGPRPKWQSDG